MTTEERYRGIIGWFSENMPVAETELHYGSAYELLVATILSAQCTDKRVNMTTPALFERFPTPQAMAEASAEEIFPYIKSISYPNNKAKNLAAMAREVMAVDTHVFRVSRRLGLTRNAKTPLQAEQQLTAHIPSSLLPKAHHWLILHGRYVCTARRPQCDTCGVRKWCRNPVVPAEKAVPVPTEKG